MLTVLPRSNPPDPSFMVYRVRGVCSVRAVYSVHAVYSIHAVYSVRAVYLYHG